MRILTEHVVVGDAYAPLTIEVLDDPGAGGASHEYRILEPPNSMRTARAHTISFQNGPIKEKMVNGVTHEAMLAVLIDRLRGFQSGDFKCRENAIALTHLEDALMWLQKRTRDRIARGVEGQTKL